jgi:hypothetical protein
MPDYRSAIGLCLLLAAIAPTTAHPAPPTPPAPDARFTAYDLNHDGTAEVRWARTLAQQRPRAESRRGLVMVIVEPRLLGMSGPASPPDPSPLWASLQTYLRDLARSGWRARLVAMQVYDGPRHQDGRTLLAMREYLRAVRAEAPDLAGVIIVGSFPEGLIVRQYNWRQQTPTVLHEGQPEQEDFGGRAVYRLVSRPEQVALRSDLALADLDGHWERLYHEGPEALQHLIAVYPYKRPPPGKSAGSEWRLEGLTRHYETGRDTFENFFYVNDGQYEMRPWASGGIVLELRDDLRDEECGPTDRGRANPLSVPQILVSRIDARHIALRPDPTIRGVNGEGLLDARGLPQTVTFASEKETPGGLGVWEWDPALEQRLLVEFLTRDHRYRQGAFRRQVLPASANYGLDSFMPELRTCRPEWRDFSAPGYDLQGDAATLTAVVEWLKRPAVLRAVAAHSDPWGAQFGFVGPDQVGDLERACGGQAWAWVKRGNQLVPALGPSGKLDFAILRSLWQNGALPDTANLYLHSGCEITAPGGAGNLPYNAPHYGYWQGAEGLLFYGQGLALVGRSKVFYDFPTEFIAELGAGKTFGEAWRHYYETESAEPDIERVGGGIGRKRAYFWNLLGDWTLTLDVASGGPDLRN